MQLTPEQRQSVVSSIFEAFNCYDTVRDPDGEHITVDEIAEAAINAILSIACPPGVEGVAGASDGAPSLPPYDWGDVDVGEPIAVVDGLPIHNSFLRQDDREAMALILKRDIPGKAIFPPTRIPSHNTVIVPKTPEPERIESMCLRYDHGFYIPALGEDEATLKRRQEGTRIRMQQLYEEATGQGFYRGVPSQGCKWALDHEYGCYLIECKGYLQTTDSPKGMQRIGGCSFKFCPWCGKPLEVIE